MRIASAQSLSISASAASIERAASAIWSWMVEKSASALAGVGAERACASSRRIARARPGDAERAAGDDEGEEREPGRRKIGAGLTALPGLGAALAGLGRERAVVGHEDVVDDDVLAAGAGEARRHTRCRSPCSRWPADRKTRYSLPPVCSSGTTAASMFQADASTPLENGQRPLRR